MNERPIAAIYYTSRFQKSARSLPRSVQAAFLLKESVIRKNIFHPSLATHKLHGKYKAYYALTVTNHYRIIFEFLNPNEILFIDIDTHEIYK
ncbi:MAG: type II toxin-antitoxin system mRNA interferase toxin, RelE/StbE family [bacterium]|nr:type II toxin-antitoxin system mRNA interferase toxin, RelE/StbE family [bacterium]